MKNLKRFLVVRPQHNGDDVSIEYIVPRYDEMSELIQDMTVAGVLEIVNKVIEERTRHNVRIETLIKLRRK